VRDNQLVKGQVLFSIDQDRFKLALRQAQAAVADRQETLAQAQREAKRNRGLGNLVPPSNWKKASPASPVPNRPWPKRR
jgi:multidrug resistance efflux pump